jgi:DNA-binding response OmpR family regulator
MMSKKKIMIVDDEPDILDYLMAVLEDNGYITCTVKNINNILDSITQEKPDLIILDIMMPDRSGLSIYREIQLTSEFKTIPVILISGLSSKNEFIEELLNGNKDSEQIASPEIFIEKPLQIEKLIKQIASLLK